MDLVANSTPMVDFESRLNSFRVNRLRRLDLPTPESPISTTRTMVSKGDADGFESRGSTFEEELETFSMDHSAAKGRKKYIVFVTRHVSGRLITPTRVAAGVTGRGEERKKVWGEEGR